MSSLVRSLLKTSSAIPSSTSEPTSPSASPKAIPESPHSGLTSSPSFNDFSFCVAREAEMDNPFGEMPSRGPSFDAVVLARESMDSSKARDSVDQGPPSRTSSLLAGWSTGTIFGRSAAINIPAAKPKVHVISDSTSEAVVSPAALGTPRRKGTGKIAGLDYYEFCELIRSSSL